MDERIVKFIKKHHALTLATTADNAPYCANAFYAYNTESNRLIFTTSLETNHGKQMKDNPKVAASIVWETKLIGKIQGVQLTGRIVEADQQDARCYTKRFPYTLLSDLTLWAIEPEMIKFTDNALGFGKKLIWNAK